MEQTKIALSEIEEEAPAEETELRVPVECYSRIVGYLRPVQNWHQGKQQEFAERKTFRIGPEVLGGDEE